MRSHHERIDGTGYPDGLAGGDIPIGARIIAVADTFDAITSTRAYREPRTHKQALQILQQEAGIQLDATAVAAFVSYYAARRSVGLGEHARHRAAAPADGLGGLSLELAAGRRAAGADGVRRRRRCADRRLPQRAGAPGLHHLRARTRAPIASSPRSRAAAATTPDPPARAGARAGARIGRARWRRRPATMTRARRLPRFRARRRGR